ncbi:MAG: toxin FitB [Pseudomonadota bacterium]|nr:toxin FitB [Pseudomonadota bacterium]
MNIVDSSAWLSWFADDENAIHFATTIENTKSLLVPSITITEVFKRILQQRDENSALTAIAHMRQGKVIHLDEHLAIDAACYSVQHKLPLADSIIYATAKKHQATIWTMDADFKNLELVKYFQRK